MKDYAIKALINTVDHLGSVAYKVNNFLDDKMVEISGMDLRLSCLEQVSFYICKCLKFSKLVQSFDFLFRIVAYGGWDGSGCEHAESLSA